MSDDKPVQKPTELVDDPDDPELSELLDKSLSDFSRPAPSATPAPAPATAAAAAEGLAAGEEEQQGSVKDAYKAFEEAIKQSLKTDPESESASATGGAGDAAFKALMTSLTDEMARSEVEGGEDPLAKTLADLSKTLTSDAKKAGAEPDMKELLKALSGSESGGDEAASLDAFMPMMQTVMASILSKDVLYPSLKDVADRYPGWLEENSATLSQEDRDRYTSQQKLMQQVCEVFEETDGDATTRQDRVFALMQKMQALGQPPKELVGESEIGLAFDKDGNPSLPAGLGGASGAECVVM